MVYQLAVGGDRIADELKKKYSITPVAMETKNNWLRVFTFLIFVISSGGG